MPTFLNIIAFPIVANAVLAAVPPVNPSSQPTTQPAKHSTPEYSFSHCLNLVTQYAERENYPMARRWAKRAGDAAPNDATREQIQLLRKRLGLLGRTAPALASEEWLVGSAGDLKQLRDRPVLVFFFQVIDQNALHSLNHVLTMAGRYRERGLQVLTVISVLEKPELQTAEGIRRFVEANPFDHLVALDASGRKTYDAYYGAGLPMFAMIDRAGRLRYTGLYKRGTVESWVLKLCTETSDHRLPGVSIAMPASPGAVDLIEKRMPAIKSDWWLNTSNGRAPKMLGRPRLVRFLHANCDDCRMAAKGMQSLHAKYANKGLVVVGILLPGDTDSPNSFDEFAATARRLEADFPIAFDRSRAMLHRWWTDTDPARAEVSDPTFVLDKRGRARLIRGDAVFYPPEVGKVEKANEVFGDMEQAIRKLMKEGQ